ncbi:MAG: DUF1351 domain-containing protein [Clostridia bacterium]|nr:DUF1351 domain-containing protein [Clostridia bacterium]
MEEAKNTGQDIQEDGLIVVKQLPVIEQQLRAIKDRFEIEAREALSLACTEETLQVVRKKRAELTKVFNALEAKRKEAKKAILSPYEAFEQVYRECVTEKYSPCDKKLAAKIKEVEDGLKEQKRAEAEAFFKEYCVSKQIDFLTFDRLGINITLNVSKKSLREQIKAFLDKVADELLLIETQENSSEILVEYKTSLNVAQAITIVSNRHKAIEEEKRRKEADKLLAEEKEKTIAKVDEAIETASPPKAVMVDPDQDDRPTPKMYRVTFSVMGTLEKIKALKEFLVKGDYQYDQQ